MPTQKKELKSVTSVPKEFCHLFWDTDQKKIDLKKNARYIIERVLENGDLKSLKWIQILYPAGLIIETLKTSRKISPKSKNFWAIWFEVDVEGETPSVYDDFLF